MEALVRHDLGAMIQQILDLENQAALAGFDVLPPAVRKAIAFSGSCAVLLPEHVEPQPQTGSPTESQ